MNPGDEKCCRVGCDGGVCEICPCCCAGWCVMGYDELPVDFEDFLSWLQVAVEHNAVARLLASYVHAGERVIP